MRQKLYTIGEIAEIVDISCKTLRYYDSIELLQPSQRDPETGYRYYDSNQVFHILVIKRLQALGFPLKEIRKLLDADSMEVYTREISIKLQDIKAKIKELEDTYNDGMLFIKKLSIRKERQKWSGVLEDVVEKSEFNPNMIGIEHIEKRAVFFTQREMQNYNNIEISIERWFEVLKKAKNRHLKPLGSIILTYHTEHPMEQFFKSSCDLEVMIQVEEIDNRLFPEQKSFGGFQAAVAYHIGDYESISSTHFKLLRWIDENGYEIDGCPSEEYLISPMDVTTQKEYVTKIIIPVKKKMH